MTMIGTVDFKKCSGEKIENIVEYVREYIKKNPTVEIMIGTDSQNRGNRTVYSTVIALYTPGNGAHCIFKRWRTKKETIRNNRLMNEVAASLEIAEELVNNGIKKPKYIDIDINPNPRYKSNEVYNTAKGWIEGAGYEVRFKTFGPLVTTFADWLVRS